MNIVVTLATNAHKIIKIVSPRASVSNCRSELNRCYVMNFLCCSRPTLAEANLAERLICKFSETYFPPPPRINQRNIKLVPPHWSI